LNFDSKLEQIPDIHR